MTYLIITLTKVRIVQGWTSPQYRDLNTFMKAICWFLGLLCILTHTYPREGLVLSQMFKDLDITNIKRGIIQIDQK